MTKQSSSVAKNDGLERKGINPATLMTLLVIPALLLGTGWVFWQQLQDTPAREVGILAPPYGIISVRFSTDPFPATTSGPVQMILLMQAGGGSTVNLDRVTYSYNSPGNGEPIEAEATQIARNTYQGILSFDTIGDWQVTITIENDGHINEGTVTVPVKPPI